MFYESIYVFATVSLKQGNVAFLLGSTIVVAFTNQFQSLGIGCYYYGYGSDCDSDCDGCDCNDSDRDSNGNDEYYYYCTPYYRHTIM